MDATCHSTLVIPYMSFRNRAKRHPRASRVRWAILMGILGISYILRLPHSACPSQDDTAKLVIPRATFLARNVATPCHQPLLLLWIIATHSQLFFF